MGESSPILIMKPRLPSRFDLRKSLKLMDSSGIYSNFGPLNQELIANFATRFNIPSSSICTVSNATLGLEGAVRTALQNGSSWSMPSWTFTATAAAALNAGEKIEFLDIDSEWRVTPNSGTRNLIDVLPFGDEINIERLPDSIENLIVDAAASIDTLNIQNFQDKRKFALVVSLHATKLIQAGEGGLFISNDVEWVRRFKSWTNFGMDTARTSNFVGTNAKLSEYAAAVCLASLKNWDRDRKDWLKQTARAMEISDRLGLELLNPMKNSRVTPYWIIKSAFAERIREEFKRQGIPYRSWWESGCHKMPAYASYNVSRLPNTELAAQNSVGLPFHLFLKDSEWKRIESALERACS